MIIDYRRRLLASTLFVAAGAVASPGLGQVTPPSGSPEAAEANAEALTEEPADTSIVVTGSRIARPDLEQASPIQVVSGEEFRLQGVTNVEEVLNDLPQVVPGTSGADNNPGGGIATVDLRGIGPQRTLVLVDGRRYVSYDVNQIVDINTIPSALLERVDVVTGGRSAIYGSDAIAGVVNFITRRNFSGAELNTQYEISDRGDGGRWSIDGTIGANFDDDRGNVVIHASYYKRKPIFAGAREFARRALQDNQDGTFIFGGSSSVPQGRINVGGLGALLGFPGQNNLDFGPDGSLNPYVAATDAYNFAPVNYLQVPQERFTIFTQGRYEISEFFQPYIEGQFINNRVDNELAPTPISSSSAFGPLELGGTLSQAPLQLQVNSPFLAPSVRAAFAALDAAETGAGRNNGYINVTSFGFRANAFGPRNNADERNAFRLLGGARGNIGGGWSYDGYFMYSRTRNTQRQEGNVVLTNFLAAARTAFRNPATGEVSAFPFAGVAGGGTLVCTTPTGAVVDGCVPANLFGLNNVSAEAGDYLTSPTVNLEEYNTQVASLVFTNSRLFDIGAGPVGVAAGVEHRTEEGRSDPDALLSSGNIAGFNAGGPTAGRYSVLEFFGETNVPLLADMSLAHRLDLNGAVRYSKYEVDGGSEFNALSWSAGAQYEPIRGLTFRGQYQQAIRGPSINELFQGQTIDFGGSPEFCNTAAAVAAGPLRDACIATGVPISRLGDATLGETANAPTFFSGNPNLTEEEAKTYTVGVVFQPSFVPRLSLTVDYFDIKIDDYITLGIGAGNILSACYEQFIDEYCDAIQRDAEGEFSRILDQTANSGGLEVRGIDFGASYNLPLNFGYDNQSRLSFSFAGSRLLEYTLTPVTDLGIVNQCEGLFGVTCSDNSVAGEPLPEWKHTLRTTFSTGPVSASVLWRYIGAVDDDDPETTFLRERLDAKHYFDLAIQAEPTDNFRLTLGVNNVFDNEPPLIASAQNFGNGEQSNTYPNTYDVLGRYFFVGATIRY